VAIRRERCSSAGGDPHIVLNPVRAGICKRPEDWPWSSYRACAGLDLAPDLLAVGDLLALFGSRPAQAQAAYRAFVAAGMLDMLNCTG
jgi:putative transposase